MPSRYRPFADHPCAAQHPELIRRAQTFLALSIGDNTRRTYTTGVNSYLAFVEEHCVPTAFPASIPTLCLWMTALASPPRPLTLGTCKVYLSAVVNRHAEMGLPNPLVDALPRRSTACWLASNVPHRTQQGRSCPSPRRCCSPMRAHLDLQTPPRFSIVGHDVDSHGRPPSHL